MHKITQTILAVGVLALVGMGGYFVAYDAWGREQARVLENDRKDMARIIAARRSDARIAAESDRREDLRVRRIQEDEITCQALSQLDQKDQTQIAWLGWGRCPARD